MLCHTNHDDKDIPCNSYEYIFDCMSAQMRCHLVFWHRANEGYVVSQPSDSQKTVLRPGRGVGDGAMSSHKTAFISGLECGVGDGTGYASHATEVSTIIVTFLAYNVSSM